MAQAMSVPEFSRPIHAQEVGSRTRRHELQADIAERAALAARFDLIALELLTAAIDVVREADGVHVTGQIEASGAQACVATGEPVPFVLQAPLALRLLESVAADAELELDAEDLDTEPLTGDIIDLGEWAAQALALALDPYPRSTLPAPGVLSEDEATKALSPFAVLKNRT